MVPPIEKIGGHMTVASDETRSGPYTGNGVTTIFNYGFRIVDETHVRVIRAEAGVETALVLGSDYMVSDVGASGGGSITMTAAPTAAQTITILRNVPFTQEVDLENQGAFFAETIETALDLAAMRDQQLAELVSRSVLVPGSMVGDYDQDQLVADIFNVEDNRAASEAARDAAQAAASALGNQVHQYDTRTLAMAATIPPSVNVINTYGLTVAGDGGGATYVRGTISSPGAFQDASGAYWGFASKVSVIGPPQGRLTLTSATPLTTSDRVGATTICFTPSGGNQVPIFNGTNTVTETFTELLLALDSNDTHAGYHYANENFDCFIIKDSATIRLGTGPGWVNGAVAGSATARATGAGSTELQLVNGFWTNKNSLTIRWGAAAGNTTVVAANRATYVGSFRTTADGVTEDSLVKRFIFNAYNREPRPFLRRDPAASWTYSLATFRQANANAANQVAYLAGLTGSMLRLDINGIASNSSATPATTFVGIGIDSTTVSSATKTNYARVTATGETSGPSASYDGFAQLGHHFAAMLERGAGSADTQTWIGTSGNNLAGISGMITQ